MTTASTRAAPGSEDTLGPELFGHVAGEAGDRQRDAEVGEAPEQVARQLELALAGVLDVHLEDELGRAAAAQRLDAAAEGHQPRRVAGRQVAELAVLLDRELASTEE